MCSTFVCVFLIVFKSCLGLAVFFVFVVVRVLNTSSCLNDLLLVFRFKNNLIVVFVFALRFP